MKVHLTVVGCIVALIAALAFAMAGEASAAGCDCTATGPYVDPETAPLSSGPNSPGGKFRVEHQTNGMYVDITVKRSTGTTVFTDQLRAGAGTTWGFSPDGSRFVTYERSGLLGGQFDIVTLYDLDASNPRRPVWTSQSQTSPSGIRFSPEGKYLLYASTSGSRQMTMLQIVETRTGDVRYEGDFAPLTPPSDPDEDPVAANWGFSPDEDAFVYAYGTRTGIDLMLVDLTARNLVHEIPYAGDGFWQFSPCGDMLGVVEVNGSPSHRRTSVTIHRVSTGAPGGSTADIGAGVLPVDLSSTATRHEALSGGTVHPLGANTAARFCAELKALEITPGSVVGGATATATVTLARPAPAGGLSVDLTSHARAATVPATVQVDEGESHAEFEITTSATTTTVRARVTATLGDSEAFDVLDITSAPKVYEFIDRTQPRNYAPNWGKQPPDPRWCYMLYKDGCRP